MAVSPFSVGKWTAGRDFKRDKPLKVRMREAVYIAASTPMTIDPVGNLFYVFPRGVKDTQNVRFHVSCLQVQIAQFLQCICIDKKRNLNRAVVTPELNPVSLAVKMAAHIGKIQLHFFEKGLKFQLPARL